MDVLVSVGAKSAIGPRIMSQTGQGLSTTQMPPPATITTNTTKKSTMATTTTTTTMMEGTPAGTTPSVRRKPRITYKSPSALVPATLRIETSVPRALVLAVTPPPTGTVISSASMSDDMLAQTRVNLLRIQKRKAARTALPLYHPLGRLALSLPELDAAALGLPAPLRLRDEGRRSSSRARRPPAKLRDAEEEGGRSVSGIGIGIGTGTGTGTVSVPVPAPAPAPAPASGEGVAGIVGGGGRDGRERNSPRKKRGSGGGAGGRRRRREADDGDATYPAKRTRNTRGGVVSGSTGRGGSVETEVAVPGEDGEVASVAAAGGVGLAAVMEGPEVKLPERRSRRRTRGGVKQRESSGSEATATSVSVSIAAALGKGKGEDGMDVESVEVSGGKARNLQKEKEEE